MRKKMKDNSLGEGKTKSLSVLQTLTNNIVWQSGVCLYFVGYAKRTHDRLLTKENTKQILQ